MSEPKEHWENTYKTKNHKQAGWYQESPDISIKLLSKINAQPTQSIIDVGCGASVLVDNLIQQGYKNITLLDLSEDFSFFFSEFPDVSFSLDLEDELFL